MQQGKPERIKINASKLRIAIAQARFNHEITGRLLDGAFLAFKQSNVSEKNIMRETVPGSAELPFLLDAFAKEKKYHALIALGCIIKGETNHYHYISEIATRGILEVTLRYHISIGFGLLTVDTKEQAFARSELNESNVGFQAAIAALECASKNEPPTSKLVGIPS